MFCKLLLYCASVVIAEVFDLATQKYKPRGAGSHEMRVAVIGAGAAGLVAARHLSESGFDCTVFEQTALVGGTWVYSDSIEGANGLPVHSSMYRSLITNIPKETMLFDDFPYKVKGKSFLRAAEVENYLSDYADHFQIRRHCKFNHRVTRVDPAERGWLITAVGMPAKQEQHFSFDAVMVCIGHHTTTKSPQLIGAEVFMGGQMHSHLYRIPGPYTDKRVLIIGAGPSGQDISYDLAHVAKAVYLSHHSPNVRPSDFPPNVHLKPDVSSLTEDSVIFNDGSSAQIDNVLYCTGYVYNYPFLSSGCGISVVDGYVCPLYKQLININHPTMCIVGIPFTSFLFHLFEIQVRYFLETLSRIVLPSRQGMLRDTADHITKLVASGRETHRYHFLGDECADYMNGLAALGGLRPVPPVIVKIYFKCQQLRNENFLTFRRYVFEIEDDENYTLSLLDKFPDK